MGTDSFALGVVEHQARLSVNAATSHKTTIKALSPSPTLESVPCAVNSEKKSGTQIAANIRYIVSDIADRPLETSQRLK